MAGYPRTADQAIGRLYEAAEFGDSSMDELASVRLRPPDRA